MFTPVDQSTLNSVTPNLDIGQIADPSLRLKAFQYLYGKLTEIVNTLNSTSVGNSGIENIGSPSIPGVSGSTAYAQIADLMAKIQAIQSGVVPSGTVTLSMLGPDVQGKLNQIFTAERAVANLLARSIIANRTDGASGFIYDLNDGLNGGSAGKLDTTTTNVVGAIIVGSTIVTVQSVTGLAAGQEVTLFDDVNLERPIISSISSETKQVTFSTALTKAYKDQAQLCRSSVVQDTTNKLLKFGGWSMRATVTQTGVNVVNSAYDTSGNGGKKLVKTANGNLFAVMRNGTTDFRIMNSTDNGAAAPWPTIATITESVNDVTMVTDGTYLFVISSFSTTGVKFRKYDQNGVLQGNVINVDSGQTAMVNVSLAVNETGTELHAAWSSKNSTYPNSLNIRYAKGIIAGDGSVTWGAVEQVTIFSATGVDVITPCIILRNNTPTIIVNYNSGASIKKIAIITKEFTTWDSSMNTGISNGWGTKQIYEGGTYAQSSPSAIIKQNGSNIGRIVCRWNGLDPTDTTRQNERWSYSDDGGVTWSAMVKITSGNTIDRQKGVLAEDLNGNIYNIYMDGTGISYQQLPNGSTVWGAVQTLDAIGTNPAVAERLDFSVPVTIYMSGTAVKFKGTWIATTSTPVLVEDVRYSITAPSNVSNAVAWVDRQTDAGLSLEAALSIHSTTENYAAMTKSTATVDGTTSEDQFLGTGASNSKATLRITMMRTNTSIDKAITQITGAVGE